MTSMNPPFDSLPTAVLLSGGLDSSILVGMLAGEGRRVQPLYVRSGLLWEAEELRAVGEFLRALGSPRVLDPVILDLPVQDLYGGHWSLTGDETPGATTPDEAVYLPGRNLLLLVKTGLWCKLHGLRQLALGVLGSNPFGDATPAFFDHLEAALNCYPPEPLEIVRPLAAMKKRQVMEIGRRFPLAATFSCIAPRNGLHCGRCNKCAERKAALALIGEDPTKYACLPPLPPGEGRGEGNSL
jgi:7-cyano-7-deazaguanine synthase